MIRNCFLSLLRNCPFSSLHIKRSLCINLCCFQEGKRTEYNIGTALRQRYHKFLGQYYYPEILEARSTDFNRTKMSLLLVLASLFPPKGIEVWKFGLNWQPVPYNYAPMDKDKVGTIIEMHII